MKTLLGSSQDDPALGWSIESIVSKVSRFGWRNPERRQGSLSKGSFPRLSSVRSELCMFRGNDALCLALNHFSFFFFVLFWNRAPSLHPSGYSSSFAFFLSAIMQYADQQRLNKELTLSVIDSSGRQISLLNDNTIHSPATEYPHNKEPYSPSSSSSSDEVVQASAKPPLAKATQSSEQNTRRKYHCAEPGCNKSFTTRFVLSNQR